jgi:hypothetical protein
LSPRKQPPPRAVNDTLLSGIGFGESPTNARLAHAEEPRGRLRTANSRKKIPARIGEHLRLAEAEVEQSIQAMIQRSGGME